MNSQPPYRPSALPPMSPPTLQQSLFTDNTIAKDGTRGPESTESELLSGMANKSSGMFTMTQNNLHQPRVVSMPPPRLPLPVMVQPGPMPPPPTTILGTMSTPSNLGGEHGTIASVPYVGKVEGWRKELETLRDDEIQAGLENGNLGDLQINSESRTQPTVQTAAHNPALAKSVPLASALGSIAERYLNLDVLNESDNSSQYVAFLLDTIQNLQSRVNFLSTSGPRRNLPADTESTTSTESAPNVNVRYQVLHRVFCGASLHNHDIQVYEDEPKLTALTSGVLTGEDMMGGDVAVPDVQAYLRNHPGIQFVVFEESFCTTEPKVYEFKAQKRLECRPDDFETFRDTISPRKERLMIVSSILQQALEKVATCKLDVVEFEGNPSDTMEMEAPYNFLFHHRGKLRELCKTAPEFKASVELLLEYLDQNFGAEYQQAEELLKKQIISDAHIGKLYRPNQTVLVVENDQLIALRLDEWPRKTQNIMRFSGWSWTYNGRTLDRNPWYKGVELNTANTKSIGTLPVCPLGYFDPAALAQLKQRCVKFWELKSQRLVTYNGWDTFHEYQYFDERFMVDMSTYTKMFPRNGQGHALIRAVDTEEFDDMPGRIFNEAELTEDQLLLLPPSTYGYSLREKKWVSINVEQISSVVWNKKAFDLLVLEEETKSLLRALIDVRMSKAKKFDDIVSGKGNGLVMLLHGSPGTGKSLTAESVAEFAEKPLFRVTCGDIGTDPTTVEKYLNTIFYLGKIWDCVLLLDEADVFLEERSFNDLQRNSLVSIFLRSLELYEGIIILTSNRVGTFDEAFQSRIRVALRYEPLTTRSRRAIWNNLFNMLLDDDDEVKVNIPSLDRRLDDLAAYKMNGRQIRNNLLTARQLALHRQESLEWDHLLQVMKLSDSFNKYLKEVKGHGDEDWAKSQALR